MSSVSQTLSSYFVKAHPWMPIRSCCHACSSQFTIGSHIVFPTLTIGLALYQVPLEGRWLATRDIFFKQVAGFWSKLFALGFVMGVGSGVVLSYEIGTNWGNFSEVTGNVLGPIMSYEVLTAFFGKQAFSGSCFLAGSGSASACTSPYRLTHMLNAAYLSTAIVIAAVAAWYVLGQQYRRFGLRTLNFIIPVTAVVAPLQLILGDLHGLNTRAYQPLKVACRSGLAKNVRILSYFATVRITFCSWKWYFCFS